MDQDFDRENLDLSTWFDRYRYGRMIIKYGGEKWIPEHIKASRNANYFIEDGALTLRIGDEVPVRGNGDKYGFGFSSIQTSEIIPIENTDPVEYTDNTKFSAKYGLFVIRAKMPKGSGFASAFWLLQTDPYEQEIFIDGTNRKIGDGIVEIDIFEGLGKEFNEEGGIMRYNIHRTADGHYQDSLDFDPSADFHTYAMNWEEGHLTWYLDGEKVWEYIGETPQKEMEILLGLYQGAGWIGEIDRSPETYPKDFEIDYLHVYQKN